MKSTVNSGNAYAAPTGAQLGYAGRLAAEAGYRDTRDARRGMRGKNPVGDMKRQECSDLIDWLISEIHEAIAAQLNTYEGDNIWQDIIHGLDRYDEARTDRIDTGDSTRFALDDGTVIRWDAQANLWRVSASRI